MANSKTFNSSNYVGKDGRNLALTVTETAVNNATNKSTVKWELKTSGGDVTYYDTYCYIKINGQQVYFSNGRFSAAGYSGWIGSANHPVDTQPWIDANGNEYTCAKWGFSTSGTLEITHDNNGGKSINVTFLVGCFYYTVKDCGGSFGLTKTDRTPPTITQNNPTSVTYNSCSISAYSNNSVNCSKWWYRKRIYTSPSWENWIEINSSGTSKSANITGLLPNTEYEFQWCGRKASNSVDGYSGTKVIKTLGASILNSVSNIYVDIASPTFTFNMTAYSTTFYHRLTINKDDNSMTFDLGTRTMGTNSYTINLSTSQVNTLISWIGSTNLTYNDLNATLITYANSDYTNQIGESSVITGAINIIIRKENAQPTLTVGGYEDINSSSIAVTNNNKYIIPTTSSQPASTVRINNIVGTSKLGANIVSIVGVLSGSVTKNILSNGTSNTFSNNYEWGTVSSETASFIEITLTDSRGFKIRKSILLSIYRKGVLVKASDYNNWYNILKSHFEAKGYDGLYFISGNSTGSGFNLPGPKVKSNIVLAENINSETDGMYKHFNQVPANTSNDYYYDVRDTIDNLKTITSNIHGYSEGNTEDILIEAETKTELDTNMAIFNNIVLFSLVKG